MLFDKSKVVRLLFQQSNPVSAVLFDRSILETLLPPKAKIDK